MRQRGFTLVELMVATFVMAILAVYSVPAYRTTTIKNNMTTMVNDFVADLHYAKTEAIKRSKNIVICAANDDFTDCSNDRSWATGWMIIDQGDSSAAPTVIKVHEMEPKDKNYKLLETDPADSAAQVGKITFSRYGFAPNSARTLVVCGPDRVQHRVKGVIVQNSGRIRLAVDTNDDGFLNVELTDGGALVDISCLA